MYGSIPNRLLSAADAPPPDREERCLTRVKASCVRLAVERFVVVEGGEPALRLDRPGGLRVRLDFQQEEYSGCAVTFGDLFDHWSVYHGHRLASSSYSVYSHFQPIP